MGQTIKVVLVVAVPVPSLCTLLHVDPIVSTYENVHDPAHKVCRHTASTFSFLDGTPRPVVCSRGGPVPTSLLILLQPARQYFPTSTISPVFIKCSYHFFVSGSPFRVQSPPYTITLVAIAARSRPELRPFPRIKNASPTQCLRSGLKPKWEN